MSVNSVGLAELLKQHRPKAAQQGFPTWLRDKTAKYVAGRRRDGVALGVIVAELGVSRTSLAQWARSASASSATSASTASTASTASGSSGFSRVMVEPPSSSATGASAGYAASTASELRVTSPHGFSIEGVSFDEALHALAVLR